MAGGQHAILEDLRQRLIRLAFVAREEIEPDARFRDDLAVDSLVALSLLIELEDAYGIRIHDEEAAEIAIVADAVALIERKLAERRS